MIPPEATFNVRPDVKQGEFNRKRNGLVQNGDRPQRRRSIGIEWKLQMRPSLSWHGFFLNPNNWTRATPASTYFRKTSR